MRKFHGNQFALFNRQSQSPIADAAAQGLGPKL
jgi:hypothetical protein